MLGTSVGKIRDINYLNGLFAKKSTLGSHLISYQNDSTWTSSFIKLAGISVVPEVGSRSHPWRTREVVSPPSRHGHVRTLEVAAGRGWVSQVLTMVGAVCNNKLIILQFTRNTF